MILKNIYLDKSFLFFLLIVIITGNFNYFIPYFLLLIIHEFGHAIVGIVMGYQLQKISFYPLGGVTVLNFPINIPLKKELLVLLAGPLSQIGGYLFLKSFFPFIEIYHYTLLIFNLLPLYPLDGGKILNIILAYNYNYLISFNITFIVSIIMIIILLVYNSYSFNLNLLMMIIIIFIKLIQIYQKRFWYYNRFLLERYLHHYSFKRIKNIYNIKNFYRDRKHYINFQKEDEVLQNFFKAR